MQIKHKQATTPAKITVVIISHEEGKIWKERKITDTLFVLSLTNSTWKAQLPNPKLTQAVIVTPAEIFWKPRVRLELYVFLSYTRHM